MLLGFNSRFQWPHCLRRKSAAAHLLRLWVRIPPGAWMFVCCECRLLSGRGLCDELITHPEESYRLWRIVVCDLETLRMRRPWTALGRNATEITRIQYLVLIHSILLGFNSSTMAPLQWMQLSFSPGARKSRPEFYCLFIYLEINLYFSFISSKKLVHIKI
jgi:hypothetical protein